MKTREIIKYIGHKYHHHKCDNFTENEWEQGYEGGKWDYLNQLKELAHYSILIGYINYYKYNGAVLDVGCGEGILFDRMRSHSYSRYVGLDISQTALDHASKKKTQNSVFIKTAIQDYKSEENFDVIIFNEVLYYFESPLQIVKHYDSFLKDDGIFIISMFCSKEQPKFWKELDSVYIPLDETKVSNKYGTSWIIKVYKSSKR